MVYVGTERTVPGGKERFELGRVMVGPGGMIRGKPMEDVEWIRSVSEITWPRL